MAAVDIKAGSPIMKTPKPPVGEGIKPLSPKPSSTVAYDGELLKTAAEGMNQAQNAGGSTKTIPAIDASKKISANKLAVLGITVLEYVGSISKGVSKKRSQSHGY